MRGNSYVPFMLRRGDGSTLSLDFTTMSGLDSRFTFSRASAATLINSSGLVQYADGNFFTNTAWLGSTLPTNWFLLFGTGTTTWNANGSVTMTAATSQRPAINHAAVTVVPGLPHTFGFLATSVNGSPQVSQVISSNLTDTYAINGVTVAGTTVVQNNDVVSCTFTPSTASVTPRIGPGSTGAMSNTSLTASRPQFNIGSSLQQYLQNTSTTAPYHAPRFDYDPTTLAARGLLIEASATNICTRSEDFANAVWVADNGSATNPSVSVVSQAAPNGGASVNRITFNKTGGTFSRIRQTLVGTSGATYTFSVWMKANTANGAAATQNVGLRIGADAAGFNCAVTTTWQRFSYSYALSGTDASAQIMLWDNIAGNDETADVLVWGAQIEAASGASSYIPTGASTVQRAAELCQMSGTNFSSWFQAGSAYSMLYRYSLNSPTAWAGSNIDRACGQVSVSGSGNRTFINAAYRVASGSGDIGRFVRVFDTGSLDMQPATLPAAATNTALAFAVNTNDAAIYAKNQIVGTDSSCTILTGQNLLDIGSIGSSQHLNGCISLIKYWPTRLSNATLQSLMQ